MILGRQATLAAAALLALSACESTASDPSAAQWQAASEFLASEDYESALAKLERLRDVPSRRTSAAAASVIILGGLTRGYLELAEALEEARDSGDARLSREMQVALDQYRKDARRYSLLLAQAVSDLQDLESDDSIELAMTLPDGGSDRSPVVARLGSGMAPTGNALQSAERQTLRRGILLQFARSVGARDDVETTRKMFQLGPVSAPYALFVTGAGRTVWEAADLFSRRRLDDPRKKDMLLDLAEQCIRTGLESGNLALEKEAQEALDAINESRDTQAAE